MKRGTPDHPKTHELAAALGLEKWGAIGVLEALFHFTAQYAKRGDIGRHSDVAIARGIGWSGPPAVLIRALTSTGWLDCCRCHRLRVHDWNQHADQTVGRSEDVKKAGFIGCYKDASALLAPDELEASQPLPLPLPLPLPTPEPRPKPLSAPSAPTLVTASWSSEACDDWQSHLGTPPGGRIGKALRPLVREHTWGRVRPIWREACESAANEPDPSYFTPEVFARTFRARMTTPRSRGKPSVVDQNRVVLERFVKGGEAG